MYQVIDPRDLLIRFNNKTLRNPSTKVFEKIEQEFLTDEGSDCRVCGFHSRKHIARTNRGNTVITCLSCGDRIWRKSRIKRVL